MKHSSSVDWVLMAETGRQGKSEKYPGDESNRAQQWTARCGREKKQCKSIGIHQTLTRHVRSLLQGHGLCEGTRSTALSSQPVAIHSEQ